MNSMINETRRVLNAFSGGEGVPRSIPEFITLCKRLRLLFDHILDFGQKEDCATVEQYLLDAMKKCITCFLTHFEVDVLCDFFATEPQENNYDTVVHPAFQALERLLSTASDRANLFKNTSLKEQIHASAFQFFGYVPTLDPPEFMFQFSNASSAPDHLAASEAIAQPQNDTGPPSRGSSSCSLDVEPRTPFESQIDDNINSTSPRKISNATLPTSSSRCLAEGMDVDEIISKGLGLSSGHRDQSFPFNYDVKHTLQDISATEEEESAMVVDAPAASSSSPTFTSGLKNPVEKKWKNPFTSRRPATLSEANKENHC